jgi:hypothetical protein
MSIQPTVILHDPCAWTVRDVVSLPSSRSAHCLPEYAPVGFIRSDFGAVGFQHGVAGAMDALESHDLSPSGPSTFRTSSLRPVNTVGFTAALVGPALVVTTTGTVAFVTAP